MLTEHYPKTERIIHELRREIADGIHGGLGAPFMTTRYLMTYKNVSLKTAHRILGQLCSEGVLEVCGKRYRIKSANGEQEKRLIGLLLTRLDNPYFSNLASALEEIVRMRGCDLAIAVSNYDGELEREQINNFLRNGVSGIIACPWSLSANESLYASLSVPLVLIGRTLPRVKTDAVLVDNLTAAKDAAKHLLSVPCEEFLYIGPRDLPDDQRLAGFCEGLERSGKPLPREHIFLLSDERNIPERLRDLLLKKSKAGIRVGVFCYHDLYAARFIQLCHEEKIAIPDDCAVCGFDNLPTASAIWPPLTSVAYPMREIASLAADMLFGRMDGTRSGIGEIKLLAPELIKRSSSKKIKQQ